MSRVGLGSLGRRWREGPSGWILWKEGDVSEGARCPSDKGWLAVCILHPCQLSGGGVLLGPRSNPELFLKLRKTLWDTRALALDLFPSSCVSPPAV